jgi:murein L,D-transpeptidase YcbB/YkuD
MVRAVKLFQARHRLKESGVIDKATVEAMNVPVRARIDQVRVNLERARWVLGGLGQDFMLVNLPAFKAYLIRGDRNVWESRTQIGQEAMQTPTFRATIRTVVLNPDWSVPESILQNEILAQMRAGKNVIDEQGLVIYDADNNVVDPSSIDWANADSTNFPYSLKQPAGDDNALGKVKFLFPNKYAIYLHDTPTKRLFEADRRTFSHGCIRIENPIDLAERLLQGQGDWGRAKIEDTIAHGETQNIAVENPLPILIVYWTVSVGASGEVRYARDIYDLDPPLLAALDRR